MSQFETLNVEIDMRFAAIERTTLGQPEVAIGILPSGSGSARLPHLVGRGRALEIALACEDFTAELDLNSVIQRL